MNIGKQRLINELTVGSEKMNNRYIFREIEKDEIPQMFNLILERIKWMDEKGIKQWNVTKYDEVYPQSYYEERRKKHEIFVLYDTLKKSNRVFCSIKRK